MNIPHLVLKILGWKAKIFEEATKNPVGAQKRTLLKYLARNKDTEYGLEYNFSKIKSVEKYQALVPIGNGESFRPYIERMAKGEPSVLTADKPVFFAITSGTTSKPKLIPVTKYSRSKKEGVTDIWAYYISRQHLSILNGKILAIISTEIEGYTESGMAYGAETGHAYRHLPRAIRDFYVLPDEVFQIEDYDARYYCILRIAMAHDITMVATLNPSTIVLLCQRIAKEKEKIIEDIKKGTINKNLNIPDAARKAIEKRLRPNPGRADELGLIIKEKKELLPRYFWPNLELIACWKSGAVKLYLKELPQYFGDVAIRDFGYLSSEARSSISMNDEGVGGVLAITTNFYEFIPREDMDKKNRRTLLCDQLEKNREYLIIVTTPGGLYRYDIDDIVKVNGFFNRTPIIEFVQKGLNAISLSGEKVYGSHVNEAINIASERHRLLITFFSASVEWGNPPRYIFLVEFDGEPTIDEKKALLASIEKELCRQNAEYAGIRKQQLLASPVLKVVRKGEFEKYRAKKISEGTHDSQFKVPELSSDLSFQKNFEIEEEVLSK